MNDTEIWKDIPGYEGYYQISTCGHVRSLDRYQTFANNQVRKYRSQPIKSRQNKHGQVMIDLRKLKVKNTHLVHRLVLLTFVGDCPDGMEGCHNDGNKLNNRLSNLRWDTHSNNELDKVIHGTKLKGSAVGNSKLDELTVKFIRVASEFVPQSILASHFEISRALVCRINSRKAWAHI
jgi:hypothetical protein